MTYEIPRIGVPFLRIPESYRWMAVEYGYYIKPKTVEWKYADYCYAGQIRMGIVSVKETTLWKINPSIFNMTMEEFMYQWQAVHKNWNDNPEVYLVELKVIGVR